MNRMLTAVVAFSAITLFTLTTANAAVLVVSARGDAAYKDGAAWRPLAKGQTIKEGTMVMTGVNSQAVLNIDDNLLTVKPLTTIKVLKNSFTKSSSDNVIGLKNGSVNARVKRIGTLKTRFNIVTPVATSSVRGTEQNTSHGPAFGTSIQVPDGSVNASNNSGVNRNVGGRSSFNLRPGNMRPDPLLGDLRNGAITPLNPANITGDEQTGLENFGDQLVDNFDDALDFYNNNVGGSASVTVDLLWPIID
ncbi:MAG TPA: FecR domain-containing protein [Spirochaetota bacterium]|nr:FecR domain-containing protein [Spirochaetota bacterium]